nr:hypothetical protein CFP56_77499 [Quercus suber]
MYSIKLEESHRVSASKGFACIKKHPGLQHLTSQGLNEGSHAGKASIVIVAKYGIAEDYSWNANASREPSLRGRASSRGLLKYIVHDWAKHSKPSSGLTASTI